MNDKAKDKLFELFSEKNKKIMIIIGIIAIFSIFSVNIFSGNNNQPTKESSAKTTTSEYAKQLEDNLNGIIASIDGAGKCKVMVTLENGTETKYATQGKTNSETVEQKNGNSSTQTKQSGDEQTEYIIIKDNDGTEKALEITELEPTVKGVVVVCVGGDNPTVQQRVVNAVTTALNISSKKVCVTKLSE